MITPPRHPNAQFATAWTAGIGCLFLSIGMAGTLSPLMPEGPIGNAQRHQGDEVMLEEFSAASPLAAATDSPPPVPPEPVEQAEIPPLPEITPPLTPPEMVELTPLETVVPRPASTPVPRPANSRPRTATASGPSTQPRNQASGGGGSGEPQLFTGAGGGNFPSPYYPPSARAAGKQGSLRLLVSVESSGLPSSVSITTSSGHPILDNAARDHVQRRWRWPSGSVRRYIVPVRYVLQ